MANAIDEGEWDASYEAEKSDRKSLQFLTKRFLEILQQSATGSLNLGTTADALGVKRRRIYDITNVLEGIGLITKCSKNAVKWRGNEGDDYVGREVDLSTELTDLSAKEKYVDQLIVYAKQNIRFIMRDMSPLTYVTRDDLVHCFPRQSVLTVKGHQRVQRLPVMVDNEIIKGRGLRISSMQTPMEVLMATDEGESLIKTTSSDDWKPATVAPSVGGGKRKTKHVPKFDQPLLPSNEVPDHFEVQSSRDDKKEIQSRFQEYKKTANLLLNIKMKNPIRDRRLRLRNYYQAKTPFVKLSQNMSCDFTFSLYEDEGISDLYDISLPLTPSSGVDPKDQMMHDGDPLPANEHSQIQDFFHSDGTLVDTSV